MWIGGVSDLFDAAPAVHSGSCFSLLMPGCVGRLRLLELSTLALVPCCFPWLHRDLEVLSATVFLETHPKVSPWDKGRRLGGGVRRGAV